MTQFSPKAAPAQRVKAVHQLIADLRKDTRPILIGPWRSELGFEVSYWLPFLAWLGKHVPNFEQRACVLSRGGMGALYKGLAAKAVDLYSLRDVTDIRRENLYDVKNRGQQKQITPTPWDQDVLHDAAKALQLGGVYHIIHPAWMYWALAPFWEDDCGIKYLAGMCDFALLPKPVLPSDVTLPPKYVAVKFYGRHSFPYPHPHVAQFVQKTVGILAAQSPVVLLGSDGADGAYDDHLDIPLAGQNLVRLPECAPEHNLLLQAAVIAHSSVFVGTYGGVAQLALRMGVPSASAWLDFGGTAHAHLTLSQTIAKATKVAFVTGSIHDFHLAQQMTSVLPPTIKPVPMSQQMKRPEVTA